MSVSNLKFLSSVVLEDLPNCVKLESSPKGLTVCSDQKCQEYIGRSTLKKSKFRPFDISPSNSFKFSNQTSLTLKGSSVIAKTKFKPTVKIPLRAKIQAHNFLRIRESSAYLLVQLESGEFRLFLIEPMSENYAQSLFSFKFPTMIFVLILIVIMQIFFSSYFKKNKESDKLKASLEKVKQLGRTQPQPQSFNE